MDPMGSAALGVTGILLGLVFCALAFLLIRAISRSQTAIPFPVSVNLPDSLLSSEDAVLLVQAGGRVLYTNPVAREWFGLLEEDPNLERLARRARPSEPFLNLCASESHSHFNLNGVFVEGDSYFIPYGNATATLVTLHRPQVTNLDLGSHPDQTTRAIDIFAELSQTIASSLDLETTLQSILESVEHLIPTDFPEITIWDTDNKHLIPYRFVGLPGVDRHLEKSSDRYSPGEGYTGFLVTHLEALLINNVDIYRDVRPAIDRKQYPFNSYLGIPLLVANEVVGTLELASLSQNAFSTNDLETLRVLSRQAAIAVQNAIIYQAEQRRVLELSGLAQLAHAASALYDSKDLFSRLVKSIKPLIDAELVGFWMYDENQHTFEAKAPFQGIPAQFFEFESYIVPILPDSPAEGIIRSQENLLASNASEDEKLSTLGISPLIQAAGITNTLLVPLTSGGHSLGYLQVGDKRDGTQFDSNDLRILTIIAGQAAIIIENANLVQQTQKRVQRSEALRRIASLTGSTATLDEILQFSLRELARLLQADLAAILLLDENRGELRIHMESLFGVPEEESKGLVKTPFPAPEGHTPSGGTLRSSVAAHAQEDTQFLSIYRPLIELFQIQSGLDVPLIVQDRNIGKLLLASYIPNFFDRSDLPLVDTAASQLAGAIDRSRLSVQTDDSLRRRVDHLTAVTRISRELNTSLDLGYLLQHIHEEVLHTAQAQCGSILLFQPDDSEGAEPRIVFQTGESHLPELSEIERKVVEREEPEIVKDYQHTDILAPHLHVRSSLVVPIIYQDRVAGLFHLHSTTPECFDDTSREIAQTFAIQTAIALGNAQRYQEQVGHNELLSRRVETLAKLLETNQALQTEETIEQSLESVAYGIQESTPFNIVVIKVFESGDQTLVPVAQAGLSIPQWEETQQTRPEWQSVRRTLQPEYRLGRIYFIPADQKPFNPIDVHFIYARMIGQTSETDTRWNPNDVLAIPLYDASGTPLGLISVDDPRDGLRPDRPTIETLEIFATQAALTIESLQKLHEFRSLSSSLKDELDRAQVSLSAAQDHLPVLLHKDLDQTLTIQNLSQRVQHIRAGLDIAEMINRQPDRDSVLLTLGREILTRMNFEVLLIAEPSSGGPRLLHSLGVIPNNVNLESLLGQRNPLRQTLQSGESCFLPNLKNEPELPSSPLLQVLEARGLICLAILGEAGKPGQGAPVEAAVLAVQRSPGLTISKEDEQIYLLLARQVAIALQNLRLLKETNRRLQEVNLLLEFSRQLGSLDPVSILDTLVNSAMRVIPAASACMVALWDPDQGCLVPKAASGYLDRQSILEILYKPGEGLPGQVFNNGEPLRLDNIDFMRHYHLPPEDLLRYQKATEGRVPISALVVPVGGSLQIDPGNPTVGLRKAKPLGVLILESLKTSAAFSSEDQAMIISLAQQTALTLENARLYQASEQRTNQLRALTDLAATITSSLQSDELIASLLDQARTIIPYDTGTLWLRQGERLTVRAARGFSDNEERVGISVAVEDSQLLKEMIQTRQPILVPDVLADPRFSSLTEHAYFSWLGVPLISKGTVVGVIALEKVEPDFYTSELTQGVMTFAGQAAVALENANLYEESLKRAQELDQRSQRLALLNRFSTELSGSLDPAYILQVTSQGLLQAIHCTAISAATFETLSEVVVAAEIPQTSAKLPTPLPFAPIFERLHESLGVFNIEDIYNSQGEVASPYLIPLASYLSERHTRALLVLPLASGNQLHGVLFIHNEEPVRFQQEEIELARTICNQAAVALQNASLFAETQRLFAETRQRSAELASLFSLGMNLSQVLEQQQLAEMTFENVFDLLKADSAMLVLQGEQGGLQGQAIDHGQVLGPFPIPENGESLSQHVLSTGQALLIGDVQNGPLPAPGYKVGDASHSWLGVPLIVRGSTIGVLAVQSDQSNQYGQADQRMLGQVGNQLAIAMDNARLFNEVQNYAASLEQRVDERTAQLASEHRRTQTLLGIITELSASLDMNLVLNRTLSLINESTSAEHSLIVLKDDGDHLVLRAEQGAHERAKNGGQLTLSTLNDDMAGWVIAKRRPILIADLLADEHWFESLEGSRQFRSAIAVPLMMGEDALGALLLFHQSPGQFSQELFSLVQATARQIAVAINNSQLFDLIKDQSERLGDMLRRQHIENSRSQAILEAVADGVLVTDSHRLITVFNASAERILGLHRSQILGQSLEHFSGLFGKAGQSWMETIYSWSEDPASLKIDSLSQEHTEQIELDDRRVVMISLAPVRLRNDFLGTVSIFRDVTHQVEVDRLKSEFVATVSHELRTPMTSIKGYVEILLMGAAGKLSDQQTRFLGIVKSNTERLAVLVNDLLDISRIEAGKVTISFQPVDLRKITRDAVDDLIRRSRDDGKPMDIRVQLPGKLSQVRGDPDRLRQILDNLLENAYYYTKEDGRITISMRQVESEVQVDVKDTGIGILPQDQQKIFERFYRGEDPLVLTTSGTGLGLSIVSRLIEMHQGRIWVESKGIPGEGSLFSFTLPLYNSEDELEVEGTLQEEAL